jgi:hypothetical protein
VHGVLEQLLCYAILLLTASFLHLFCHLQEDVILRELARKRAVAGPTAAAEPKVDHLGRARAVGGRKTSTAQVRPGASITNR